MSESGVLVANNPDGVVLRGSRGHRVPHLGIVYRRVFGLGKGRVVDWCDVDGSTLGEQPLGMPTLDSSAFQLGLRIQAEGFDVFNALVGEGIGNPEEPELGQERLQRSAAC